MQNQSMFPDWVYGLYGRQLPNFSEPIRMIQLVTEKLDVTTGKARQLLSNIMGTDGVVVRDDFIDYHLDEIGKQGVFYLHIQEACIPSFLDRYKDNVLIDEIDEFSWRPVCSMWHLSQTFPDEFEGRYFCDACSVEKKGEMDPCENGNCRKGLTNFKGMQEELQGTIAQMERDRDMFDNVTQELVEMPAMAEEPAVVMYACPVCETQHPGSAIDEDGEICCNHCEENGDYEWFDADEESRVCK